MEDAIGDEKGGENIDSVMQMSEQNYDGKKSSDENKNLAQNFILPKNKSQEKRQTGMTREEKTSAKKIVADKTRRINNDGRWKRADMSHAYEDSPNDCKESDTFDNKGNFLGFLGTEQNNEN